MPNRCIWCGIWHHGAAVQAFQRHRQTLFRGLYFHNAICRVPSGSGCQAHISLINELLLKFHKSNSITRFLHAPSALMECRNVSFSHFCLEFIWLISVIHVLPLEFRFLRVYERQHVWVRKEEGDIATQTRPLALWTFIPAAGYYVKPIKGMEQIHLSSLYPWKQFTRQLFYRIFFLNLCRLLAKMSSWVQAQILAKVHQVGWITVIYSIFDLSMYITTETTNHNQQLKNK